MKLLTPKKLGVIFEFLVFGIVVGIAEDLIAIELTTDATITWQTVYIVLLVAIPFAILGEIIADNIDFSRFFKRFFKEK